MKSLEVIERILTILTEHTDIIPITINEYNIESISYNDGTIDIVSPVLEEIENELKELKEEKENFIKTIKTLNEHIKELDATIESLKNELEESQ